LQERSKILRRLCLQRVPPHYFPQLHCASISQVSSYILRLVLTFHKNKKHFGSSVVLPEYILSESSSRKRRILIVPFIGFHLKLEEMYSLISCNYNVSFFNIEFEFNLDVQLYTQIYKVRQNSNGDIKTRYLITRKYV
jgi:hypothetical protein